MKAEYIDHLGDDLRVVNAARVSFAKEHETFQDNDGGLIRYLASNGHWTPFSHVAVTIRETIPIFLARQRFKHMVGFTYNEVSRRYVDDEPEFYRPVVWRTRAEDKKQGSGLAFDAEETEELSGILEGIHSDALADYRYLLGRGVAPEQARMVLPQSMYTSYYVTGSLAAWARAYKQRIHEHAQREWDEITPQWNKIIEPLFPTSWKALTA